MQSAPTHLLLLSSTLRGGLTGELVAPWSPSNAVIDWHDMLLVKWLPFSYYQWISL